MTKESIAKIRAYRALRKANYYIKELRKNGFRFEPKEGNVFFQVEGFTWSY